MTKVNARFVFTPCLALLSVAVVLLCCATPVSGNDRVDTFWPLFDYRADEAENYVSLNLLGPLVKYRRIGAERMFSIRPLYTRQYDQTNLIGRSEFLYPVATKKDTPDRSYFSVIQLLISDFGSRSAGSSNEFTLFPLLFYGNKLDSGKYFAFFPVGGVIKDKYAKDEIVFALFPLYARTRTGDVVSQNYLWPFFNRIRGGGEDGLRFWPFFGYHRTGNDARSRFIFWPFFFAEDHNMATTAPSRLRAFFPFYIHKTSFDFSSTSYLWPFIEIVRDRRNDYVEHTLLWPLLRFSNGGERDGFRILPFYLNERIGEFRKRWYLWPLCKIEEIHTEQIDRRRFRLLYFLYSDLTETVYEGESLRRRRIDFWPFFSWDSQRGVTRFHILSLLEPFFPDNGAIERNWSPLYRIYQLRSDHHGNEISSFLWNLYWKERRGDDVAVELFPIFYYRNEKFKGNSELSILKGLIRFHRSEGHSRLTLLYLPWGISWGDDVSDKVLW